MLIYKFKLTFIRMDDYINATTKLKLKIVNYGRAFYLTRRGIKTLRLSVKHVECPTCQ